MVKQYHLVLLVTMTLERIKMKRAKSDIQHDIKNEDLDKSAIKTAGYWSNNLLWNKDTLQKSIDDISRTHNLSIKMK